MEKTYFVQRQTMSGIADEVRTLSGDGVMMKPETMREELIEANDAVVEQDGIMNEIRDILSSKRIPEETLEGLDEYVDFYDYDGTLLHRYTVLEIMGMDKLPPLPSHEGLICQGWNWTLKQLKDENGGVDVAPYYKTDDDKTRLVIEVPRDNYLVGVLLAAVTSATCFIDWDDGADMSSETLKNNSKTFQHTYNKGVYTVKIWFEASTQSDCYIGHNWSRSNPVLPYKNNRNILKEFYPAGNGVRAYMALDECGNGLIKETFVKGQNRVIDNSTAIVKVGNMSYSYNSTSNVPSIISTGPCTHLGGNNASDTIFYGMYVKLPTTLRSVEKEGSLNGVKSKYFRPKIWNDSVFNAVLNSAEIDHIILPDGITEIKSMNNVITKSIELPDSVTKIGDSCFHESTLNHLRLSDNLEIIPYQCCRNCKNLRSIKLPKHVKRIEQYAFYFSSLEEIELPDGLEYIGSYAFANTNIEKIYMPDSVIECVNPFAQCSKLKCVRLSNNVQPFSVSNVYVDEMNIPTAWNSVPNVSYVYDTIRMDQHTKIPTLSSTSYIYSRARVLVPSALYDEWIKATNWSAIASRIVPV